MASASPAPSKETTPLQSTVLFLFPLRAWPGAEVPGLSCPWALGRRRGQGTSRDVRWLSLSPAVLFSSSAKSVSEPRSRLRKVKMLPRLERGFMEVLLRPWMLLRRFWGHREKAHDQASSSRAPSLSPVVFSETEKFSQSNERFGVFLFLVFFLF